MKGFSDLNEIMNEKLRIADVFFLNDGRTILTGSLTQELDIPPPKRARLVVSKENMGVIQINWESPLDSGDPTIKSVSTIDQLSLTKAQIMKGDGELEFLE